MSAPPLRVMLVEDHEVVRDGIKLLLNRICDVVVGAEPARQARPWPWPPGPCPR